jgi:hypothetical protein
MKRMKDMKIFWTQIATDFQDLRHRGLPSRFKVPALAGTSRGAFNTGSVPLIAVQLASLVQEEAPRTKGI